MPCTPHKIWGLTKAKLMRCQTGTKADWFQVGAPGGAHCRALTSKPQGRKRGEQRGGNVKCKVYTTPYELSQLLLVWKPSPSRARVINFRLAQGLLTASKEIGQKEERKHCHIAVFKL